MTGRSVPDSSSPTVRIQTETTVKTGPAIGLEESVDPDALFEAIRSGTAPVEHLAVETPAPPPVYDHVGYIHPEMGLRTRTALARAGRSRGLETPYDTALTEARERYAQFDIEEGSLETYRRELADTTGETDQIRERVATIRGKLQALRDRDHDPARLTEKLEATIQELSEIETRETAARQRLDRARTNARKRRDRLETRLELEDEIANLERRARSHLVDQLTDEFASALTAVPDTAPSGDPFEADPVSAGLAVARLASLDVPLVLVCDQFETPQQAHEWTNTPVVVIEQ